MTAATPSPPPFNVAGPIADDSTPTPAAPKVIPPLTRPLDPIPVSEKVATTPYGASFLKPIAPKAKVTEPQSLDQSVTSSKPMKPPIIESQVPAETIDREPRAESNAADHAADFSWIVGRLEFLNMKGQWRVRYAAFDADDKYGGVATLSGVDHLTEQLKDGMVVRLHGQLVDPDSKKSSPEYFVHDIKIMK